MSTQTQQTAAPTQQGSHHFILTTQRPSPSGFRINTLHGTFTPAPESTRKDAYEQVRAEHDRLYPHMAGGTVLFFAFERNQL